jgi:hypothetical protein
MKTAGYFSEMALALYQKTGSKFTLVNFFFLVVLVLELKVLHFTTRATPPALFALVSFEDSVSHFAQVGLDCNLSAAAGMTGMDHHAQLFSIDIGSCKLFCLSWPGNAILLISASQIVRMTGVSHWDHLHLLNFRGNKVWAQHRDMCTQAGLSHLVQLSQF